MKKVLLIIVFTFCVSISFAQRNGFDDFKKLFKKIEIPFVLDSCSVDDLVFQDDQFPKISKRMKNYIPKAIQEELFREQSVRAYYNFPLSDKYVSLMIFAGSYMDEDRVTNSVFYLVNYDFEGNIIDYIRVASYICEGGYSCCTINQHNIWYISYEECPVKFKYAVHEVIPMIESRLKYDIGTDGHFSKKEVLFYRKGFYKATADGDFFRFYKSFPEE